MSNNLEDRITRLEELAALDKLMNTYHWRVDQFDWEGWADCFTEDAVFEMPNLFGTLRGRNEILSTCKGAMAHVYDEIQHIMINLDFELTGADTATGHGNLIFAGVENRNAPEKAYTTGGRYTWKYVKQADGWRIKHSTCLFLWNNGASGSTVFDGSHQDPAAAAAG